MGWLKDNLIAVLGCLCLALAIGWLVTHYIDAARMAELRTSYNTALTDAQNLREANRTATEARRKLEEANKELAAKHAADEAAAREAALRLDELREELGKQVARNAELRRKLAEDNPDVDTYLDGAMPCELARQLWGKQAGYCAK